MTIETRQLLQVVNENATEQFLNMRRRDQQRAMGRLREDSGLRWDICSPAWQW